MHVFETEPDEPCEDMVMTVHDLFTPEQAALFKGNPNLGMAVDVLPIYRGQFRLMELSSAFDLGYFYSDSHNAEIAILHKDGDKVIDDQKCFLVDLLIKKAV